VAPFSTILIMNHIISGDSYNGFSVQYWNALPYNVNKYTPVFHILTHKNTIVFLQYFYVGKCEKQMCIYFRCRTNCTTLQVHNHPGSYQNPVLVPMKIFQPMTMYVCTPWPEKKRPP